MKKIVNFIKKHKKLSILFLIFSFILLFCIYDRSYIYPPIFFFDTNPVMIKLFKNKDNVNKADKYGITPLMKAVAMRNEKSVKLLLEKGADPNYVVDWLGEAHPDNWIMYTFLMNRMNRDKKENEGRISEKLPLKFKIMKEITKITGYDRWPIGFVSFYPAKIACNGNEYEILKLLIENQSIIPSLRDLSSYKKGETEKILKFLLSKGAGNNKDGVIYALKYADMEIAEILLKSGISPNIITASKFSDKDTPLYRSVTVGYTERVKLLLQYGADIYLKDENGGESAFEYVQNNRNEIKKDGIFFDIFYNLYFIFLNI